MLYTTYIVRCVDGTLYAGITVDVARRIREHNAAVTGAKYTRSRRPVVLVYSKRFRNRSRALQEEARIKTLSRQQKILLINSNRNMKFRAASSRSRLSRKEE